MFVFGYYWQQFIVIYMNRTTKNWYNEQGGIVLQLTSIWKMHVCYNKWSYLKLSKLFLGRMRFVSISLAEAIDILFRKHT